MKFATAAASVVLVLAICCKKKDVPEPEPTPPATTTGGTTTGGTTSGGNTTGPLSNSNIVPTSTAGLFHGYFSCTTYTYPDLFQPSNTFTGSSITAYFMENYSNKTTYSGTVRINRDSVTFSGGWYNRSYSNHDQNKTAWFDFMTQNWELSGKGGLPTFTFVNNIPLPSGLNLEPFPSVVSKSAGLSVTLTGMADYRAATMNIFDKLQSGGMAVSKIVQNSTPVVNFSPSELSALSTGTTGFIGITLENFQGGCSEGKDFKFSRCISNTKTITIVP